MRFMNLFHGRWNNVDNDGDTMKPNEADIIINNLLQSGNLNLSNIENLNGNTVTIKMETFAMIRSKIDDLHNEYMASQNLISILQHKINALEMCHSQSHNEDQISIKAANAYEQNDDDINMKMRSNNNDNNNIIDSEMKIDGKTNMNMVCDTNPTTTSVLSDRYNKTT